MCPHKIFPPSLTLDANSPTDGHCMPTALLTIGQCQAVSVGVCVGPHKLPVSTLALETDNLLHCVEFNIDSQINTTHSIDFRSTVYAHIHRQCWSALRRYHYMYVVIADWPSTCVSQILPYTNCRLLLFYIQQTIGNMPVNTTTRKLI